LGGKKREEAVHKAKPSILDREKINKIEPDFEKRSKEENKGTEGGRKKAL
jgi:hypothetical protein